MSKNRKNKDNEEKLNTSPPTEGQDAPPTEGQDTPPTEAKYYVVKGKSILAVSKIIDSECEITAKDLVKGEDSLRDLLKAKLIIKK